MHHSECKDNLLQLKFKARSYFQEHFHKRSTRAMKKYRLMIDSRSSVVPFKLLTIPGLVDLGFLPPSLLFPQYRKRIDICKSETLRLKYGQSIRALPSTLYSIFSNTYDWFKCKALINQNLWSCSVRRNFSSSSFDTFDSCSRFLARSTNIASADSLLSDDWYNADPSSLRHTWLLQFLTSDSRSSTCKKIIGLIVRSYINHTC